MKEQNGLGFVSSVVSFETPPSTLNAIKTICRERRKEGLMCRISTFPVIIVSFFSFFKKEKSNGIVVCANFVIVLFANYKNVATFAPKFFCTKIISYDREH